MPVSVVHAHVDGGDASDDMFEYNRLIGPDVDVSAMNANGIRYTTDSNKNGPQPSIEMQSTDEEWHRIHPKAVGRRIRTHQ